MTKKIRTDTCESNYQSRRLTCFLATAGELAKGSWESECAKGIQHVKDAINHHNHKHHHPVPSFFAPCSKVWRLSCTWTLAAGFPFWLWTERFLFLFLFLINNRGQICNFRWAWSKTAGLVWNFMCIIDRKKSDLSLYISCPVRDKLPFQYAEIELTVPQTYQR